MTNNILSVLSAENARIQENIAAQGSIPQADQKNALAVVYFALLGLLQTHQQTILTQANEIANNATTQNTLNTEIAKIHFIPVPSNATSAQINHIQVENELLAEERANGQNIILTVRQNGQVMITRASATMDMTEQTASEASSILQSIGTTSNSIIQMGRSQ